MEIIRFLEALWQLSTAMAPYILFGLLFAGILHALVPDSIVTRHLGKNTISSVVKSTIFGIPLPVCSCGVIPLASSIKKSGASKGATLSFLISTPITGVDSILATYGIFGWIFTLYRIFTSMIIAMVAGVLTNMFDKDAGAAVPKAVFASAPSSSRTSLTLHASRPRAQNASGAESCCGSSSEKKEPFSLSGVLRYAFVTLLGDIAKPLFWGLLLGAVITVAMPEDLASLLREHTWLAYLIVIAIAVPMYVCATASLPIAAGLMLGGVSAGAAFVFLSAGPATNTVTIGVVKKMLGGRSLAIYLGSITIGSILFGLGLDYIFDKSAINPASLIQLDEESSVVAAVSSVMLWGLVLYYMVQPYFSKKDPCDGGTCCAS